MLTYLQSSEQVEFIKELRPEAPILKRIHPIYAQFPAPDKKLAKRGKLELLFFGFIRPYKGLDILLEALDLLGDDDIHLTIVGEQWGKPDELNEAIDRMENVEAHLEYVSDQEAANYFARADVVVLPYRAATGSGVVTLAYNYGKPVLATNVGGLKDAVADAKTGWLVEPDSPRALADRIKKIKRKDLAGMKPAIKKFCKDNSWDAMADAIREFARKLN